MGTRAWSMKQYPRMGSRTVPDAHVADMRYLHEQERKTHVQVHAKYSQYRIRYVRSVLDYVVRADVKPAAADVSVEQ